MQLFDNEILHIPDVKNYLITLLTVMMLFCFFRNRRHSRGVAGTATAFFIIMGFFSLMHVLQENLQLWPIGNDSPST